MKLNRRQFIVTAGVAAFASSRPIEAFSQTNIDIRRGAQDDAIQHDQPGATDTQDLQDHILEPASEFDRP